MKAIHHCLFFLVSLSLLASCSGERQLIKSPTGPQGLAVLGAGLEPSTPLAFERAVAWASIRGGEKAAVHLAHVDSAAANEVGFVPSAELFSATNLEPVGERDALGRQRFEFELPPRPPGKVLYYWFQASDASGGNQRLPESAPEGAIPVGSTRFEIDFPWPAWSEPFDGLDCWADPSLFSMDQAVGGPNFDEIVAPIWVPMANATIFASSVGSQQGVGVIVEGQAYFYPLNMMLWNEVANDEQQGLNTVLSYCPLTDTALFFSHENQGKFRKFETAGLFNSNLMVGDPVLPRSIIPQMLAFGATGSREGECVDILPSFICRRSFWAELHPSTLVMDGDSVLSEEWNWARMHNPYSAYWRSNSDIRAPIAHPDNEHPLGLQNKDLVVGVIGNGDPTVYPVHRDAPGGWIVYNDDGGARPMLFVWLERARYGAVFDRRHPETGELLDFRRTPASFNGVGLLEDLSDEPSLWTPGGLAISGRYKGSQLAWLPSYRSFWFAWHTIYPHSRMVDLPTAEGG